MTTTIEPIIASIDAWRGAADIRWEPLNGGFTNDTYKVEVGGEVFALRVNGRQNDFLGLDRLGEIAAVEAGHALGIAPEVVHCQGRRDILITRFLPGRQLTPAETHHPDMIQRLAGLMRTVHSMQGIPRVMGPFDMIRRYLDAARALGVAFPENLAPHLRRLDAIERERSQDSDTTGKFCHNDFFIFNMVYDEGGSGAIRLTDWELSGTGDVFFELSTLPYVNRYGEEQERCLLQAYFGCCDDDMLRTLHNMMVVSLVREIGWALLHTALVKDPVNHNIDYMGFVHFVLERLDAGHHTLS
jgi:thiamine kinase-like enzyme